MIKNVCPRCSQVTISLEPETSIRCPLCEEIFGTGDSRSDNVSTDVGEGK